MTLYEIKNCLFRNGKKVQDAQVYRYMRKLSIKPQGALQIPRRYPDDSAARILAHLGLNPGVQIGAEAPLRTASALLPRKSLVTRPELARARAEGRRAKR